MSECRNFILCKILQNLPFWFEQPSHQNPVTEFLIIKENPKNYIKIFITQQTGDFYSKKDAIKCNKDQEIIDFARKSWIL